MNKKAKWVLIASIALVIIVGVVIGISTVVSKDPDRGTESSGPVESTEASGGEERPTDPSHNNADAQTGTEEPTAADKADEDLQVGAAVGERGDYASEEETKPADKQEQSKPQDKDQTTGSNGQTTATQPPETKPSDTSNEDKTAVTFAQYNAMTEDEQEAFVESFESLSDFVEWWNAAQKDQGDDRETIEIVDGTIDLGNLNP